VVRTRRTDGRTPDDRRASATAPRLPDWLAAGNARVSAYLRRAKVGSPDGVAINKDKIPAPVWEGLADNYLIAPRGQGHETKLAGGNLKEAMDALTPGAAPTYPT
jgi:hypothetical protein